MDDLQDHLFSNLGFLSPAVIEQVSEQCRPCWIFATEQVGGRERAAIARPEPEVGRSKLGGAPDMPGDTPWPLDTDGATLDFLLQIRLDHGPSHLDLPTTGLLLFFAGVDELDRIEHKVLLVPADAKLVRRTRPGGNRIPTSVDYQPLAIEWKPSFALPREQRSYQVDTGEVDQCQIQEAIDAAALGNEYVVGEPLNAALSRFGGWPLSHSYFGQVALSAYIVNSPFADHGDYRFDFERRYDFSYGQRTLAELQSIPNNKHWARLVTLIQQGDAYVEWIRDRTINHTLEIAAWNQLLSLDSHLEIGMCFHDAGIYEFVFCGDRLDIGNAQTYLELCL